MNLHGVPGAILWWLASLENNFTEQTKLVQETQDQTFSASNGIFTSNTILLRLSTTGVAYILSSSIRNVLEMPRLPESLILRFGALESDGIQIPEQWLALALLSSQDTGERQSSTGKHHQARYARRHVAYDVGKCKIRGERAPAPAEWGEAFWAWLESRSKVFATPLEK